MDKWTLQEQAYKRGYEKGKADAVVRGRWQERRFICMDNEVMLGYRCSECNLTYDVETNYCPNCGAKMDGGNEDG